MVGTGANGTLLLWLKRIFSDRGKVVVFDKRLLGMCHKHFACRPSLTCHYSDFGIGNGYVLWVCLSLLVAGVVPMPDHDQRFKTLIKEFFPEFLRLFFPKYANRLVLDSVNWEPTELLPHPPDGSRHFLDLVAKLKIRQGPGTKPILDASGKKAKECFAVIHLEIESSKSKTSIMNRLPTYYIHLRNRTKLPVLPIIIFLNRGGPGHGIMEHRDSLFGLEIQVMRFLYVALKGLNALEYMKKESLLAVALTALMDIPEESIAWVGAEALRKISQAPLKTHERFLLGECVRAYLPMGPQHGAEWDNLLATETFSGVKAMNKTIYEEGIEKGVKQERKEGLERGRAELIEMAGALLEGRFGPLPAKVLADLKSRSRQELRSMITNSPRITSLDALDFDGLQ